MELPYFPYLTNYKKKVEVTVTKRRGEQVRHCSTLIEYDYYKTLSREEKEKIVEAPMIYSVNSSLPGFEDNAYEVPSHPLILESHIVHCGEWNL